MSVVQMVKEQLEKSFETLNLEKELKERLKKRLESPDKVHTIQVKVELSDNKQHQFDGFRVQHCNLLGPYKGGLRFHPNCDLDESTALANWMTLKTALLNLPFGGGKGGLAVDPTDFNEQDLETIVKEFGKQLAPHIGVEKDVPAPDVGTNGETMLKLLREYQHFHQLNENDQLGVYTGKPVDKGGIIWRTEATGYGVALATRTMLGGTNDCLLGKTFVIQGMGNVGKHTAEFLTSWGMKLIAVADHTGYRHSEKGFEFFEEGCQGLVSSWKEGEIIDKERFFSTPCDVFIPAALEMQLDEKTVPLINCSIVVEAANGPTTPKGEEILVEKKIKIVPDILANSGGVLVSYYEWFQNSHETEWNKEMVCEKIKEKMIPFFETLRSCYEQDPCFNSREYCYHVAFKNLSNGLLSFPETSITPLN